MEIKVSLPTGSYTLKDGAAMERLALDIRAIMTRNPATGIYTLGAPRSLERLVAAHADVRDPAALAQRLATHAAAGHADGRKGLK